MTVWADNLADSVWRAGLTVIPLAVLVAIACRSITMRPATRHSLWVLVLAWFVLPAVLPLPPIPEWLAFARHDAAHADVAPQAALRSTHPAADVAPATAQSSENTRHSIRPEPRRKGLLAPAAGSGGSTSSFSASALTTPRAGVNAASSAARGADARPKVVRHAPAATPNSPPAFNARRAPRMPQQIDRPAAQHAEPRASVHSEAALTRHSEPAAKPAADQPRDLALPTPVAPPARTAPIATVGENDSDSAVEQPLAARRQSAWYVPWITAVDSARRTIAELPALPWWVWLGGAAVVVAGAILGSVRFLLRMRRARLAPKQIQREVAAAAAVVGLRKAPQAYLVGAGVSPLIWCGLRPRLILPRPLWMELDDAGRRAVLCHELAHLKRRDHWVRWGELVVCTAYWWHPLAWWVRGRVSEEAENCCDAWVTWLLPRERRAYAEALLRANEYMQRSQHAAAPMGLGVLSGRAKRMARRLTMVMTHTTKPGLSGAGITLAVALALIGWSTTPLWACPKKVKPATTAAPAATACETTAASPAARAIVVDGGCADATVATTATPFSVTVPATPRPVRASVPALFATSDDAGTYQNFIAGRRASMPAQALIAIAGGGEGDDDDDDELERRLGALEQQLERVAAQLSELGTAIGHGDAHGADARAAVEAEIAAAGGHGQHAREVWAARAARSQGGRARVADALRAAAEAEAHAAHGGQQRSAETLRMLELGAQRPALAGTLGAADGETVTRAYRLAEGKLAALTGLLIRDDVPLKVRPGDGQIEIIATPAQHELVAAFIDMLESRIEWREYKLSAGKLEALSALMVRDDVPIMVRPGSDSITIQASTSQHRAIEGFLKQIEPEMSPGKREAGDAKSDEDDDAKREKEAAKRAKKAKGAVFAPQPAPADYVFGSTAGTAALDTLPTASPAWSPAMPLLLATLVQPFDGASLSEADAARRDAHAFAAQMQQQADQLAQQAEMLRGQQTQLSNDAESLATNAEDLAEQTEFLNEQAEQLSERASSLRESAQAPARDSAAGLRDRALAIEAQAKALEAQADGTRAQVDHLRAEAESLEEAAEALRASAAELMERFAAPRETR